jgi:hypothetical protein
MVITNLHIRSWSQVAALAEKSIRMLPVLALGMKIDQYYRFANQLEPSRVPYC